VGRIRCRAVDFVLALFLLVASTAAFGGRKAAKLNETIDLPQTFEADFQFAAKQRAQLGQQKEVPDDVAGRVGQDVFESLIKTQMISGFGLPYTWTFRLYDNPAVNAGSLADGEVEAYTGLSHLIGTNRGLWAAVLSHEIAHVARRHAVRKALFHEYVEQQVAYWQMRARLGDKGAGWTALAVRVAGNLAEKKLSRDLEHDADIQGMLLMARAGYHPDNAFAMHHLLRMNTPERSRVGTFFLSDHPRWESRDQRTERAYTEAIAEYDRLWASPDASPGGLPPAVAFLGGVRGMENKGDGAPVQSAIGDYRDSSGNVLIHEALHAWIRMERDQPSFISPPLSFPRMTADSRPKSKSSAPAMNSWNDLRLSMFTSQRQTAKTPPLLRKLGSNRNCAMRRALSNRTNTKSPMPLPPSQLNPRDPVRLLL
jgi:hypothetical protein